MSIYSDELEEEFQVLRGHRTRLFQHGAPGCVTFATDIPDDAILGRIDRQKKSHQGLGTKTELRELFAGSVNQNMMDEIAELKNLEVLFLGYPITADDISAIAGLKKLHTLKIDSPRKITDFSFVLDLPNLHTLLIENAKHLNDLGFLASAHRLKVIGVEGDMSTMQKVDSLKPLGGLKSLEVLFLTTVQLKDKDLTCLATCPELRLMQCARFAPKKSFDALRAAMPDLVCRWCDQYEIDD